MALPADFSKIYGSTATGGLTPISDVNYAKGWEYVGANPPTKNDFSYLQNMSDQKSKWLYDYLVLSSNAASRKVGNASGNIPDMSLFASSVAALASAQKFPTGLIIQCGKLNAGVNPSSSYGMTFPMAFNSIISVIVTLNVTGGSGQPTVSATNVTNTRFDIAVSPGSSYGSSVDAYYMAMGY